MRCLTQTESEEWVAGHSWPQSPDELASEVFGITASVPQSFTSVFWFSELLSKSFEDFDTCLLRVKLWGDLPSRENLHLYYKLRESYGEIRLLHEAPGHLFQKYERADLATFIEMAILFGWDFELSASPSWMRGLVYDESFDLFSTDAKNLDSLKENLHAAKIDFKEFQRPISES